MRGFAWSRRSAWWLAAMVIAVFFACWSLLGVVADISAFRAKAWVETWSHHALEAQARGELYFPDAEDWQQAQSLGKLAVTLSPFNADYREGLARVHEARFIMAAPGTLEARPDREEAAQLYREAIVLRPTWPYAHAALAYALLRAGGHQDEMELALAEAARLGPWEPLAMEAIVDIGLDAWYQLTPASREVVTGTLSRSQSWQAGQLGERHADRVWAIVSVHRKQALACSFLPMTEERNRRNCNPANWGPEL